MRRLLFILFVFAGTLLSFGWKVEEVPNVHVQNRTRFLSNPDNVISAQAQTIADSIMQRVWNTSSVEMVAVVVDQIDDSSDPETFATELFEHWGIGKKDNDNGVLVLVSVQDRAAVVRTGYGVEGIIPDIKAGSIIRNKMFPRFRKGDYDGGLLEGLGALAELANDPDSRDEVKSQYENDADAEDDSFAPYFWLGGIVSVVSLIYILLITFIYSKKPSEQWQKLSMIKLPMLMVTVFFIGIPVLSYLLLLWRLKVLRKTPPSCPRCHGVTVKLKGGDDRRWLSSGQLVERHLKSVDHDVWECSNCGFGIVRSYKNPYTSYTECEQCHAIAKHLVNDRILRQPTTVSMGLGERVYRCEHCGNEDSKPYEIPRKTPVVVVPGGRGGGGFGGFSGGSFGGGHTGGGGASGRW